MRYIGWLALCGVMLLPLSGCNQAEHIHFTSNHKHTDFLARRYKYYSMVLHDQQDFFGANHFAKKAINAVNNVYVDPEQPERWNTRFNILPTLKEARLKLMDALTSGVIYQYPELAATTQFFYDCWVMQEKNWKKPTYTMECRNQFQEHLTRLEAKSRPVVKQQVVVKEHIVTPTSPPQQKVEYEKEAAKLSMLAELDEKRSTQVEDKVVVYFTPDGTTLEPGAAAKLNKLVLNLKALEGYDLQINAHTDTVGDMDANLELSRNRAVVVRDELVKRGIDRAMVRLFGFGETDLAVKTADEVREPKNNRVEIIVE